MMVPFHALGLHHPLPPGSMGPRNVILFRFEQLKYAIMDSLVICGFMPYDPTTIAELTAAVTGWDTGVVEQFRVGDRMLNMARLFNIREGFTGEDDKLPLRYYQPKSNGPLSNRPLKRETMEKAKRYYYTLMGWDPNTGIPLPEKIEELEID